MPRIPCTVFSTPLDVGLSGLLVCSPRPTFYGHRDQAGFLAALAQDAHRDANPKPYDLGPPRQETFVIRFTHNERHPMHVRVGSHGTVWSSAGGAAPRARPELGRNISVSMHYGLLLAAAAGSLDGVVGHHPL